MPEKYYLDTSIWMDYYEDRYDSSKPLGEIAFHLLSKLLASKSAIVVSTFLLRELESAYSLDEVRGMAMPFEKHMQRVSPIDRQIKEAMDIAEKRRIPMGDCLHAILARDNHAILVSRDKHFQKLKDICEVMMPEEII